jgi:hypothetical protein
MQVVVGLLHGSGLAPTAVRESKVTAPGQWHAAGSAISAGPWGKMRFHLRSEAEVEQVRQLLREKVLQAGPDLITLIVHETGSGFPSRRPNRRAGPPGAAAAGLARSSPWRS